MTQFIDLEFRMPQQAEVQIVKFPLEYTEQESVETLPAVGFILGTETKVSIVFDAKKKVFHSFKDDGSLCLYSGQPPEEVIKRTEAIHSYDYLEENDDTSGECLVIKDASSDEYYRSTLSPTGVFSYGKFLGEAEDGQEQWDAVKHFDNLPGSVKAFFNRFYALSPSFSIIGFCAESQAQGRKLFPKGFYRLGFSSYTTNGSDTFSITYDGETYRYAQEKPWKIPAYQNRNHAWYNLQKPADWEETRPEGWGESTIKSQGEILAKIRTTLHYQPATFSHIESRWHWFTATSDRYKGLRGDVLKTTILAGIKRYLTEWSFVDVDTKVNNIKGIGDYATLAKSQGLATRVLGIFGKKTSSIKAFDKLVEEAKARETMMRR